jgi:hypothetical protein
MLASLAIVVLTATAAWAPKYLLAPSVFGDCSTNGEAGDFSLSLDLSHFEATKDGGLNVIGVANGICDVPDQEDGSLTDAPFGTSVTVGTHTCRQIVFELGSYTSKDTTFDLTQDPLVINSFEVGRKLCAEAKALDRWSAERLASYLTKRFL